MSYVSDFFGCASTRPLAVHCGVVFLSSVLSYTLLYTAACMRLTACMHNVVVPDAPAIVGGGYCQWQEVEQSPLAAASSSINMNLAGQIVGQRAS